MGVTDLRALVRRHGAEYVELELHGFGEEPRTRRLGPAVSTRRKLARLREAPHEFRPADLAALGYELYGVLFPTRQDQDDLKAAMDGADLVVLDIASDDPESQGLPWELLNPTGDGDGFLVPAGRLSMVRSLPSARPPELGPPPWRMLYVVSMPVSAYRSAPIQVLEEHEAVRKALRPWIRKGLLEVDILERATLPELRAAIRSAEHRYQILHVISHGTPGGLLMEDPEEREAGREVLLPELADVIGEVAELKVLVLNACLTAASPAWGPSVGFSAARRLAPVVLANQTTIRIDTAIGAVSGFYDSLAQWRSLDQTLDTFRRTQREGWWQPVVFLPAECRKLPRPDRLIERRRPDPYEVRDLVQEAGAFIFRYDPVRALGERLRSDDRVLALHGVGGMGKSLLAAYAARLFRARFSGVFFCDLRERSVLDVVRLLVRKLAPPGRRDELLAGLEEDPPQEVLESLLEEEGAAGFLLVLDNAEAVQDERGHLRRDLAGWRGVLEVLRRHEDFSGRVLLTTRVLPSGDDRSPLVGPGATVEVGELYEGEHRLLVRLLGERLGTFEALWERLPAEEREGLEGAGPAARADALAPDVAVGLAGVFGRSPLLVRLALNQMKELPSIDPTEVLRQSGRWMDFYREEAERRPEAWAPFLHLRFAVSETLAAALCPLDDYRHLLERLRVLETHFEAMGPGGRAVPHRMLVRPVARFLRAVAEAEREPDEATGAWYRERLGEYVADPGALARGLAEGPLTRADLFNLLDRELAARRAADVATLVPAFLELGPGDLPADQARLLERAFDALGDDRPRAEAALRLGALYGGPLREPDAALRWSRQGLDLVRGQGDRAGEARAVFQVAGVHLDRGELGDAIAAYHRSLELHRELGDRTGEAASAHQIGRVHQDEGELDEALGWYRKGLEIGRELGNRAGEAKSAHQIGRVHQDRGEFDEAFTWYHRSLETFRDLGDRSGEAKSARQIGRVHLDRDELDDALRWYRESLGIDREQGHRAGDASGPGRPGRRGDERPPDRHRPPAPGRARRRTGVVGAGPAGASGARRSDRRGVLLGANRPLARRDR